nr:hypothetical protein [Tanacetum cinerariifolium]
VQLEEAAVVDMYRRSVCPSVNSKIGEESFEGHNTLGDDSKPKLSRLCWDKVAKESPLAPISQSFTDADEASILTRTLRLEITKARVKLWEQREFYMSVLRSHAGWKTKHLKGMTLEEIKEKSIPVWKQLEDFVPMSSKEEGERIKRKGLNLDQRSAKRIKTFEVVSEEDLKGMMQLVPLEEVYVEALQFDREDLHQLWILVKEPLSIKQDTKDKEKELQVFKMYIVGPQDFPSV